MNDADASFDYIETAPSKFDDGPFLLGQFSIVSGNLIFGLSPFFFSLSQLLVFSWSFIKYWSQVLLSSSF
ncbi:unnamed protein product [Camellia sinensis]